VAQFSEFKFYEQPELCAVEDIENVQLEAFLLTAIVNPFGPTVNIVAALGRSAARPLMSIMLNPFSQQVQRIGTYIEGDQWFPVEAYDGLTEGQIGSCPTLVLFNKSLSSEDRNLVGQSFLDRFKDAEVELERVRAFFGNPMDRVSHVMFQANDPLPLIPAELVYADWIEFVSDSQHIWPEIRALLYGWDGAINQTGINDSLRFSAFTADRLKAIISHVFETLWVPAPIEAPRARPPAFSPPIEAPETGAELEAQLANHDWWRKLRGDDLLEFLKWAMLLYGRRVDGALIEHLQPLYKHAMKHIEAEPRVLFLQNVALSAETYGLDPCTVMPPLILDDDKYVVSTAIIDYVALCHPDTDGLPQQFGVELDRLFRNREFQNPGAVIGGLITLGDCRFHKQIHVWKQLLDQDGIEQAIWCQTPFITHGETLFWLDWAEELLAIQNYQSKSRLGLIASALFRLGKRNPYDQVRDVERRYPAGSVEEAVVTLEGWTRQEYSKLIANRLYHLEEIEEAPKIFSDVLRAWGLEPRAPLMEQFIAKE